MWSATNRLRSTLSVVPSTSSSMPRSTSIFVFLLVLASRAQAGFLEQASDALLFRDSENRFQLQLSGLVDLEGYYTDQPPSGLIYTRNNFLFNPRLSIFADAQYTRHLYLFVQTRVDRGFDPSDESVQIDRKSVVEGKSGDLG